MTPVGVVVVVVLVVIVVVVVVVAAKVETPKSQGLKNPIFPVNNYHFSVPVADFCFWGKPTWNHQP